MIVEIAELIWQNVGVWTKIEGGFPKAFLHSHNVEAEAIFARNFVTLRKMVNLLILIQTFILVRFARARTPQEIPLVRVCRRKSVLLQHRPTQLVVKANHFVEKLRIFDVVRLLVAIVGERPTHHLLVRDVLEVQKVALILVRVVIEAVGGGVRSGSLRKETRLISRHTRSICGRSL